MNRKERRQQQKNNEKALNTPGGARDMPLPQALEKMVSAYEAGKREEAFNIARQLVPAMPDDPDLQHFAGTVALETGRFDEALAYLSKTVELKPDHAEAWNGLGHVYLVQKKVEAGITACEKAVDLMKGTPEAHYNLGSAYSAAGRMEDALQSYQAALALKPDYPEALNNMGNAFQALRRFDEAQSAFEKTLAVDPGFASARFNLANTRLAAGRIKDAIAGYEDSIEANPQHLPSYNNLATVFRQVGRLPEAAETYRKALAIKSDVAELHNNLGVVLQDTGATADSAESFRKALELDPENAEAAYNLHAALFDDTDLAAAAEALERALEIDPRHERANFMLGAVRDRQGETEQAEACFAALPRAADGRHPAVESWEYMKSARGERTRWFAPAAETLRHSLAQAVGTGAVLEFGVRYGASLRLIADEAGQPVHGFDSFRGLPADWYSKKKGSDTTFGELPDMPDPVTLHAGWFAETLPAYLAAFDEPVRFAHVDCDLYASTVTVFDNLAPRIVPGSVILFGEYLINPSWREDAFKAFQEAVEKHGWKYEYVAFSLFARQAGVRILEAG